MFNQIPFVGIILVGYLVIRQVAQKEKGKHVIAEIVRVHGPARLVGNGPEGAAQLFLILFSHCGRLSLQKVSTRARY